MSIYIYILCLERSEMEFGVFYKHRQLGAVCNYKLLKKKQIVYYQMFT